MRQRIISALIGLLIMAVVFAFYQTVFFNLIITAITLIAVFELLRATGCSKFRGMTAFAMFIAVVIPFARETYLRPLLPQILFLLVIAFFLLLLKNHRAIRVEQAAMTFLFAIIVPLFFASAIYIRDDFGTDVGMFYLLWALGSAWLCDTGAYFTGIRFGKHKMAPVVSPKKTVEGAVGGLLTATLVMVGLAALYAEFLPLWGGAIGIRYDLLIVLTPVFAAIGILGDLSASVIKRQFQVKDYGHIMPGHGGVLDRFDSVLFTLPAVYISMGFLTVAAPL